ncbi:MAG: flavohemoglobin expression-modulating QEGLA motif protein [Bacteroidales bacterium]|nr:flavohemoglobin expression-modulating QEGLA motif protein [Bacteroidales bacterium]
MHRLTPDEIIKRIEQRITFEATTADGSLSIKIEDYTPFVCVALHCGHNLREELREKCLLDEGERLYEEDPETDTFILSFPITIKAHDSRYEYDLNRNTKEAVYTLAWGKKVWRKPLSESEIKMSIQKHHNFYSIVYALIHKLESLFNAALIFDIHSYNYKRIEKNTPVFNIGSGIIDPKYRIFIEQWIKDLRKINLPGIDKTVEENDVFAGCGYLIQYINEHFDKTLVLPTEIKKIYCNEENGEKYPQVIEAISKGLKKAVLNTSVFFARKQTNLTTIRKHSLLSSDLDKTLLNADKQLFNLVKDFEILNYVNPLNIEQEKKQFYKSKYSVNPQFKYRQIIIDPFSFKKKLYAIPVEKIRDINIQILYKDIIDAYADKVDMIANIGNNKFLYNSLRYFGEPDETDVSNAHFLLHIPSQPEDYQSNDLGAFDVEHYFKKTLENYGFSCKIEISRNTVSKVMVLNSRKLIRIRRDARFTEKGLYALAEHEIGVHMLTTINARLQPLKFLWLGMPVNTMTQEGLAVLSEYLSGNITVTRLKELALRVLAIKSMLQGNDFRKTYQFLVEQNVLDEDKAFYLTARVYRSGGFTKDYLYLKGFRKVLDLYQNNNSVESLLIGKTSLKYHSIINEMIERKLLLPPKYVTNVFRNPIEESPIINFIISGIKSIPVTNNKNLTENKLSEKKK